MRHNEGSSAYAAGIRRPLRIPGWLLAARAFPPIIMVGLVLVWVIVGVYVLSLFMIWIWGVGRSRDEVERQGKLVVCHCMLMLSVC